ncbi:hypothetical protein IFM89_031900 [Coptis chinensis]|uniref:Uncharacterized protein n=1 Tax=Coptis chinensis TaxID=261450 RepID=A0A835MG41_9MAGN|nr:hypothetical protein IFM89_031900 [Coptis chinensis]
MATLVVPDSVPTPLEDADKIRKAVQGCIQEQYLVEEVMMYCMEYIHDGNLGSHKNGRRVIMNEDIESAHPMDKKGKQYVLPNIEYQQVRKWVLTHSPKNVEWEE